MQFKRPGTEMDQPLDGGLKPKYTNSWGTKNIIIPRKFDVVGKKEYVCKLKRPLHVLKQSPR